MRRSLQSKWLRSRWTGILALLAGLCIVAGYSRAAEPLLPSLPDEIRPGRYRVNVNSQDWERTALVQIPENYTAEHPCPLVIVLHGGGGNEHNMLERYGWADLANRETVIVVSPAGLPVRPRLPGNFWTNPCVWNSGQLNPALPRTAIDDVRFLTALLDIVQERVRVDAARVFVTGHSNGAGMTFRLGAELSERLTGLAPVAGMLAVQPDLLPRPLPTLYIIGTVDPLLPLAGGEVQLPWGARTNVPVETFLTTWASALGCTTDPQELESSPKLKRLEYPPQKTAGEKNESGGFLQVVYVEGQGHTWPGGSEVLPQHMVGPAVDSYDATEEIWKFFAGLPSLPPQKR